MPNEELGRTHFQRVNYRKVVKECRVTVSAKDQGEVILHVNPRVTHCNAALVSGSMWSQMLARTRVSFDIMQTSGTPSGLPHMACTTL